MNRSITNCRGSITLPRGIIAQTLDEKLTLSLKMALAKFWIMQNRRASLVRMMVRTRAMQRRFNGEAWPQIYLHRSVL